MTRRVTGARRKPGTRARSAQRGRPAQHGGTGQLGQVRLIGGRWRGRRLAVVQAPGLRPSPDRLRETVFNWLAPRLPGAHCLDLFAGSGALGLEAASRGAASVTLVERHPHAAACLRASIEQLEAGEQVSLIEAEALSALQGLDRRWDIVFIDPPFADGGQAAVLQALLPDRLGADARVHVESGAGDTAPLADGFEVLRDKRFGDARARLLTPLD